MTWVLGIVVVLVMGGIAYVASGRGAPMVEEYDDRPDALVPASGDLEAVHLRRVRFSLAFRGYRMSEVDALLSRLASQLETDRGWQPAPATAPSLAKTDTGSDAEVGAGGDAKPEAGAQARREDDVPPG